MRPDDRDAGYLWDMLEAAKAVREFITGRKYHDYLGDKMLRSAVERQVEVIGEAAHRVSAAFRSNQPEIPWSRITGLRNVIAHEYGDIRHEVLWKVATIHIPELIARLEPLVPPLPEGEE